MSRQRVSATPPGDVDGFPVWHVLAGATLFRITAAPNPWWFSSDGSGRFDLIPPRGTCYLADEAVVAVLEAIGPDASGVDAVWLERNQLWALPLPEQCDAADLTARPARGYGVTAELGAMDAYDLPQAWARALAAAGHGGVRYRSRHDPAGGRCLALFGAAGERARWKRGRPAPVPADLLAAAGIAVAGPPASADLGPALD